MSIRRATAVVAGLACCGALGACGGSGNPTVNSGDFVSACVTKTQQQNKNVPSSINLSSVCQCLQPKLEAAGLGTKTINDLNTNSQAQSIAAQCVASTAPGQGTPSTPSTPSTPQQTTT
jgi:hypothetical protein